VLRQPLPDVADAGVYAPATDVAAMRHEIQAARLFAN
jgi:urease accessory protein UreF